MKNQDSYTVLHYSYIAIIVLILIMMCTSCSIVTECNNTFTTKIVVAKDKDSYNYLIALNDGSTYYTTFGEYSIIDIGDTISFNRRQTKIINLNK